MSARAATLDTDLIVIAGAPGAGKSTLCLELKRRLMSPFVEFSRFREPHLDSKWSNSSPQEEEMAFENLCFVVENYLRHGYRNVVVTDLTDERLKDVPRRFSEVKVRIFTLVMKDESELQARIQARAAGFTNVEAALAWNRQVTERPPIEHEVKLFVDGRTTADLASSVLEAR